MAMGFAQIEDIEPEEMNAAYFLGRRDKLENRQPRERNERSGLKYRINPLLPVLPIFLR